MRQQHTSLITQTLMSTLSKDALSEIQIDRAARRATRAPAIVLGTCTVTTQQRDVRMEGKAMTTQHSMIKAMEGGLVGTLLQILTVYVVIPMLTAHSIDTAALFERACDVGMLAHVVTGA